MCTFDGEDQLTAGWTWFEKREPQFTETIDVRRVKSAAETARR